MNSEWDEEKEFTEEQERDIALKKYNNILTSGRCSKKDTKDVQILSLVGVSQKIADNSKTSYEKPNTSNRDLTKG